MARYIDADKMREEWLENGENEYVYDTNSVLDSIDEQPTADVVEVKQIEIIRDDLKWWLETNTEKGVVYIPKCVVENMIKKMTRTPKERGEYDD